MHDGPLRGVGLQVIDDPGRGRGLAIARAILSRAPILVTDERSATSTLSPRSRCTARCPTSAGERTLLVVAHRPSTIRTADRNVVLSDGRVVDSGGYQELLASDGPFAALVHHGLDRLE